MEENKQLGQDHNPNPQPNQSNQPVNQPQAPVDSGSNPQNSGPQSIDEVIINSQSGQSANESQQPVSDHSWQPPKTDDTSSFNPEEEESSFGTIATIVVVIVLVVVAIWFFNKDTQSEVNQETAVSDGQEQDYVPGDNDAVVVPTNDDSNTDNSDSSPELTDQETVKITAYFSKGDDCSSVFPLEKEIEKKYDSDVINTVRGLLYGLTAEDVGNGYTTNIPSGTYLNRVDIDKGVATVKLSEDLNKVAGSCAVTAARAQIEKTLLQFPYISAVVICAGDNCNQDEILQP